jgi:hypothetical protein
MTTRQMLDTLSRAYAAAVGVLDPKAPAKAIPVVVGTAYHEAAGSVDVSSLE